jgi:DNA-binding FadR family transcriptional regulator
MPVETLYKPVKTTHHKRILRAIARRDPAAAREAVQAHLRQVGDDVASAVRAGHTKGAE